MTDERRASQLASLKIVRPIESAEFTLTADNSFELRVNGRSAGSGNNFHQIYKFDIEPFLKEGTNTLEIIAENSGANANPAGLIGRLFEFAGALFRSSLHDREMP